MQWNSRRHNSIVNPTKQKFAHGQRKEKSEPACRSRSSVFVSSEVDSDMLAGMATSNLLPPAPWFVVGKSFKSRRLLRGGNDCVGVFKSCLHCVERFLDLTVQASLLQAHTTHGSDDSIPMNKMENAATTLSLDVGSEMTV